MNIKEIIKDLPPIEEIVNYYGQDFDNIKHMKKYLMFDFYLIYLNCLIAPLNLLHCLPYQSGWGYDLAWLKV